MLLTSHTVLIKPVLSKELLAHGKECEQSESNPRKDPNMQFTRFKEKDAEIWQLNVLLKPMKIYMVKKIPVVHLITVYRSWLACTWEMFA